MGTLGPVAFGLGSASPLNFTAPHTLSNQISYVKQFGRNYGNPPYNFDPSLKVTQGQWNRY